MWVARGGVTTRAAAGQGIVHMGAGAGLKHPGGAGLKHPGCKSAYSAMAVWPSGPAAGGRRLHVGSLAIWPVFVTLAKFLAKLWLSGCYQLWPVKSQFKFLNEK